MTNDCASQNAEDCGLRRLPVAGADLRAALVASCLRGALPPVDLRAVCLVRAMAATNASKPMKGAAGIGKRVNGWEREGAGLRLFRCHRLSCTFRGHRDSKASSARAHAEVRDYRPSAQSRVLTPAGRTATLGYESLGTKPTPAALHLITAPLRAPSTGLHLLSSTAS